MMDAPLFVVLLRFADHKDEAGRFLDGHKAWLQRGFDDGVFLLAGSLQPRLGGAIMAANTSRSDLETRVGEDPFVAQNVARAEILEITPSRSDERLKFLVG